MGVGAGRASFKRTNQMHTYNESRRRVIQLPDALSTLRTCARSAANTGYAGYAADTEHKRYRPLDMRKGIVA